MSCFIVPTRYAIAKALCRDDASILVSWTQCDLTIKWTRYFRSNLIIYPLNPNTYKDIPCHYRCNWPDQCSPLELAVRNANWLLYDKLLYFTYSIPLVAYIPILKALAWKGELQRMQFLFNSGRVAISDLTHEDIAHIQHAVAVFIRNNQAVAALRNDKVFLRNMLRDY
jgi:hypothetical protein